MPVDILAQLIVAFFACTTTINVNATLGTACATVNATLGTACVTSRPPAPE
jgi:hypothetical protein